jgi:hypothetical protein
VVVSILLALSGTQDASDSRFPLGIFRSRIRGMVTLGDRAASRVLVALLALLTMPGCFYLHMPSAFSRPEGASPEVRALVTRLYDPDPQGRAQACLELQRRGDTAPALPYLLGMIYDDTMAWKPSPLFPVQGTEVGNEAAAALGHIGKPAVEPLIDILERPLPDRIRARAARGLNLTRDARATAPLVHALDTTDPELRYSCVLALQSITGRKADDANEWREWFKASTQSATTRPN